MYLMDMEFCTILKKSDMKGILSKANSMDKESTFIKVRMFIKAPLLTVFHKEEELSGTETKTFMKVSLKQGSDTEGEL